MAKRPLKLRIRIPPYETPRNSWRRKLHACVVAKQKESAVRYRISDRLEVQALIYMKPTALRKHDVDNRLKDILDALQGRAGGPKSRRALDPIIPNDCVVYRAIVEKREIPKQSRGDGHLIVRRLSQWTLKRVPLRAARKRSL